MSAVRQSARPGSGAGRLRTALSHRRGDVRLLAVLLLVGVALPLVTGLLAGAQDIPRNDDWVYRRIALELARTGVLALHSVTTMMVGQIVLAQPFLLLSGLQPWAFTAAGVIFAIAGVLAPYVLARQFLPPIRATVATSLLLLFPGYLAYATSFMTDVPTVASQLACLALGAVALQRGPVGTRWLVASVAIGWLGFSIREFAIAAPASVLLGTLFAEPRRTRHRVIAAAFAVAVLLLYLFKADLSGQQLGTQIGYGAISQSIKALSSVSLVLLPAALAGAASWRHTWARRDVLIGLELGIVIVGYRLFEWIHDGAMPLVILDDLASQTGTAAGALLIGGRPLLFADPWWVALNALALIATVVLLAVGAGIAGAHVRHRDGSLGATVKGLGSPTGLLMLFTVSVMVGLTGYSVLSPLYDRYYWPVIVPLATLFLLRPAWLLVPPPSTPDRRSNLPVQAPVAVMLAVLSIVSLVYMLNSYAYDPARWRAGERMVQLGVRPDELDAGYEWLGYHAPALPGPNQVADGLSAYERYWPAFRACGVVSGSPLGLMDYTLVGRSDYPLYLIAGPQESLYLYRATSPDCLAP